MTHTCHWPECKIAVPPAMFMCRRHWFMLPFALRNRIFAAYRTGQETTKRPSAEYIAAVQAVQEWIREQQRITES